MSRMSARSLHRKLKAEDTSFQRAFLQWTGRPPWRDPQLFAEQCLNPGDECDTKEVQVPKSSLKPKSCRVAPVFWTQFLSPRLPWLACGTINSA